MGLIRFTRIIKDNKIIHSSKDNEKIIKGCFEPCTPAVRARVNSFLDNPKCHKLTQYFKNDKIVLEKS